MFDILGNIAKFYRDQTTNSGSPSQIPFGQAQDISRSFPKNSDWVENTRAAIEEYFKTEIGGKVLSTTIGGLTGAKMAGLPGMAIGAFLGLQTPKALQTLDKTTEGRTTKLLNIPIQEVRSNYAYKKQLYDNNIAVALLSTFTASAAALGGAAVGLRAGGVRGIKSGAALGVALESKLERVLSKTDLAESINEDFKKSALIAESAAGQEKYNFGRDVTGFALASAAKIQGKSYAGDITKGIPAIMSGFINVALEWGPYAPDMATFSFAGAAKAKALVNPISTRPIKSKNKILTKLEAEEISKNIANNIDLLNKTAAGQITPYTPLMDFIEKSDAATLTAHPMFNTENARMGAAIFAGQNKKTQALLFAVGQGYLPALDQLWTLAANKALEIERFRAQHQVTDINGRPTMVNPTITLRERQAALDALLKEERWLNQALGLQGRLQSRTAGKSSFVEKLRIDRAENKIAKQLETKAVGARETKIGAVLQTIYQDSGFGTAIRSMNRLSDDQPHATINFNDAIGSQDRVRTNIRAAVRYGALDANEAQSTFNSFLNASKEIEKFDMIEKYNTAVIKGIAKKYNISDLNAEAIVNAHNLNNRLIVAHAKDAKELERNYMFDPMNPEEFLHDPQLITQLANGSYMVDIKTMDKALAKFANENKLSRFTSKEWDKQKSAEWAAVRTKNIVDEVMTYWRGYTLMRGGYPINIIRDSTLRLWGDMHLLDVYTQLGKDFANFIGNTNNTVGKIRNWQSAATNPKSRIKTIRKNIDGRVVTLQNLEKELNKAGYDVNNPPTKYDPDLQDSIDIHLDLKTNIDNLRAQEAVLIQNITGKEPRVRTFTTKEGYELLAGRSGRFGELSQHIVYGADDIRRALSSSHELAIKNSGRGRTGGQALSPVKNESRHLQVWEQTLNDKLRHDDVARKIMAGESKKDIVAWLRGQDGYNYLDRMGYGREGAPELFAQVKAMVDWFAPSQVLRDLVMADKLDMIALAQLYPDINTRPLVISDALDDTLGLSEARKSGGEWVKDKVAWLSTQPTGVLMNSPYFEVLYQEKMQELISTVAVQGRTLLERDRIQFDKVAREYAIHKQKNILNAFHRNMNYNGAVQYMLAFFPALVEQFKAYGKIVYDRPEFIIKALRVKTIPEQFFDVQTDQFGQEYIETTVPGSGVKARISVNWFNPVNPTGGSIVSAGPALSVPYNELVKRFDIESKFTDLILPFGVQENSLKAVTPNTIKKSWELYKSLNRSGEQYNKDANMLLIQRRKDFLDEYGREPTPKELNLMAKKIQEDAISLSILRFSSAWMAPTQPRFVTPISAHADILSKFINQYGMDEGSRLFSEKYPDFYLLSTHLSDSTSGINPNRTTMELVKNNKGTLQKISTVIGKDNIDVLGSIFRDDSGEFSKSASIYLENNLIPGQSEKFRNTSDYIQANRASIVSKGYADLVKLISIIRIEMEADGYTIANGYGKAVLDSYKAQFIEMQKELNPIWYAEKMAGPELALSKLEDTVSTVTIALSDDKIWKVLSKQPLMHTIAEYMSLRYDVNEILYGMNITYNSERAADLRDKVSIIVENMKKKDINFEKWYERYFANDDFGYVYREDI